MPNTVNKPSFNPTFFMVRVRQTSYEIYDFFMGSIQQATDLAEAAILEGCLSVEITPHE